MSRADQINETVRKQLEATDRITLGHRASVELHLDPKHLVFVLSRYKFVSKLFEHRGDLLEVGAGDGLGALIVAQAGNKVTASDLEQFTLDNMAVTELAMQNVNPKQHDILTGPVNHEVPFDAAYSLDVLEHFEPEDSQRYLANIVDSVKDTGAVLIGTPNETAAAYASPNAAAQHINLHDHAALKELMALFFENVFMFGMNDEVVHTGYPAMCHYLFALGVQKKSDRPTFRR